MLVIKVLGQESTIDLPDGSTEFVVVGGFDLELEHSLAALSKWESQYEKPFLTLDEKTSEEIFDYIRAMAIRPDVPAEVFLGLTAEHLEQINKYINKKQTATWFSDKQPQEKSTEVITSELIYYWMDILNIPSDRERWHLNRLFTLIKIHSLKQQKPTKMSRDEALAEQRRLNAQRRKEFGIDG